MKKILCCILIFFGLIGCANQAQEIYMQATSAIYIDENLMGKKVYVNFNENEGNLTEVVKFELIKNGYIITQEELSDINVKGRINFFRKNSLSKPTILMDTCFSRHYRNRNLYYTDPFNDDFYNKEYYYDAQISLFITIKNKNTYSTNLNLESEKSQIDFSKERTMSNFNDKIAKKVVEILNGY
ncbi:hypothetical protein [Campylobacter hyointestinalis]|uniref:hypothetical protein n=1 Tax=Campylobacter hyointestinalis TaxID=198 RepID=UPI000DCCD3E3|nr:hypothetical protein [Campylobacter hyointestinalis]RAZ60818.1 hypothetical protein CHL10071_04080 [Campylobacter hyointestinalis subsp. lawsonii]